MTDTEIPTGPVDREPLGFPSREDSEHALRQVLADAGVELGAHDETIVRWLQTWEWSTIATIASWVQRAAQNQR
ncbi:hypothetical protein [Streptomyces sp. SAI-229]|jgi:hypothetical protein|uniref:hypothetical protein n=1 Tax=Streptomyces sp. SAI-229 TaxID=3377731 RepID=UPI003C7C4A6B